MTTLHLHGHTDENGDLRVHIGRPNTDVSVDVTVPDAMPQDDAEWLKEILALEGSIDDPTFRRNPVGEAAPREPLK